MKSPLRVLYMMVALGMSAFLMSMIAMKHKAEENPQNVLGSELKTCCIDPMTGFYRDGSCKTGSEDQGTHVVCAQMTEEFLRFTKSKGNDLSTPIPAYNFPGLKPGDKWCLCALRWREALKADKAPPVILERTNAKALDYVSMEELKANELVE
ncbi:DUF2237 domain-containing protein [Gangjinia marincola]|uniref:DUF2237 domain-containing protein n=1 Tax=Gangjinia marincola TaxID=578463 RepID=A0ABP3XXZ9_9FLAO